MSHELNAIEHQSRLAPEANKFHIGNGSDGKHYWLTPSDLYRQLDLEFGFDFDPCPFPKPADFDGLTCEWGQSSYVNPPFGSIVHEGKKKGPTAWARKAISEQKKGKRVVLVYPIDKWVLMLLAAGAEVRNLGDVRWVATEDGSTGKGTGRHIACFVLSQSNANAFSTWFDQTVGRRWEELSPMELAEIGEHSSANDPWHNAMLAADDFLADQLRKLLTPPAASEPDTAAGAKPEFFTVFAWHEGGGEAGWIALPGYSNETINGVKNLVLEAARKEGYKGTVAGRLLELGWEIHPVYAAPPATSERDAGAKPFAYYIYIRDEKRGGEPMHVGPLNPNWLEWLMGWPIGWTALEPLETARFREWQQQHSLS